MVVRRVIGIVYASSYVFADEAGNLSVLENLPNHDTPAEQSTVYFQPVDGVSDTPLRNLQQYQMNPAPPQQTALVYGQQRGPSPAATSLPQMGSLTPEQFMAMRQQQMAQQSSFLSPSAASSVQLFGASNPTASQAYAPIPFQDATSRQTGPIFQRAPREPTQSGLLGSSGPSTLGDRIIFDRPSRLGGNAGGGSQNGMRPLGSGSDGTGERRIFDRVPRLGASGDSTSGDSEMWGGRRVFNRPGRPLGGTVIRESLGVTQARQRGEVTTGGGNNGTAASSASANPADLMAMVASNPALASAVAANPALIESAMRNPQILEAMVGRRYREAPPPSRPNEARSPITMVSPDGNAHSTLSFLDVQPVGGIIRVGGSTTDTSSRANGRTAVTQEMIDRETREIVKELQDLNKLLRSFGLMTDPASSEGEEEAEEVAEDDLVIREGPSVETTDATIITTGVASVDVSSESPSSSDTSEDDAHETSHQVVAPDGAAETQAATATEQSAAEVAQLVAPSSELVLEYEFDAFTSFATDLPSEDDSSSSSEADDQPTVPSQTVAANDSESDSPTNAVAAESIDSDSSTSSERDGDSSESEDIILTYPYYNNIEFEDLLGFDPREVLNEPAAEATGGAVDASNEVEAEEAAEDAAYEWLEAGPEDVDAVVARLTTLSQRLTELQRMRAVANFATESASSSSGASEDGSFAAWMRSQQRNAVWTGETASVAGVAAPVKVVKLDPAKLVYSTPVAPKTNQKIVAPEGQIVVEGGKLVGKKKEKAEGLVLVPVKEEPDRENSTRGGNSHSDSDDGATIRPVAEDAPSAANRDTENPSGPIRSDEYDEKLKAKKAEEELKAAQKAESEKKKEAPAEEVTVTTPDGKKKKEKLKVVKEREDEESESTEDSMDDQGASQEQEKQARETEKIEKERLQKEQADEAEATRKIQRDAEREAKKERQRERKEVEAEQERQRQAEVAASKPSPSVAVEDPAAVAVPDSRRRRTRAVPSFRI